MSTFRVLPAVVFLIASAAPAPGATELAAAVSEPRVQASTASSGSDALSRRPVEKQPAAAPKSAPVAKPAELQTEDIEIWLGEGIGRFGDYEFSVLGGKPGHPTPTGAFKIEWKSRKWWSKQYNAPMPYSCFFHRGAAIHEGSLRTRSHGCIHVSKDAAKRIFGGGKEKVTRVIVYP